MSTTLTVRDLMQTRVHTVPPEMPLLALEQEFTDKHASGLPVVDGDELVGVVSRSDIVRQSEVGEVLDGEFQGNLGRAAAARVRGLRD